MQLNIWIATPEGYTHSRSFEFVALSLRDALRALGYESEVMTTPKKGKAIILGAHLADLSGLEPEHVIFNLEQINEHTPEGYIDSIRRFEVWDYSYLNIEELKKHGVSAKHCGVGYMPCLERIDPQEEDIDVLFIGALNHRRKAMIYGMESNGIKAVAAHDCYGEKKDQLIARSKIILNMHFYESKIFEITRCSYALANHKCVVSEFGEDEELEEPFYKAIAFASYAELVPVCLHYLEHDDERKRQAAHGYEIFKGMSQIDMIVRTLCLTSI